MPKISIITINYNDAEGLLKTMLSVNEQSYTDFEHLIIDGLSADESQKVIQQNEKPFTRWVSEKDKGIYDAQNKGIALATGEYCLFLNAGDYLADKEALERAFSNNPNSDLIGCDMQFAYQNKLVHRVQPESISRMHLLRTSLWHPATFIKRKLFEQYGNYDLRFKTAADYDFFVKIIVKGGVSYEHRNVLLSVFDTGGVSSSTKGLAERKQERIDIQKQYFPAWLIYANVTANKIYSAMATVKQKLVKRK